MLSGMYQKLTTFGTPRIFYPILINLVPQKNIREEDFLENELESMPGFRLSWYYTGLEDQVKPDSYSDYPEAQLFIR